MKTLKYSFLLLVALCMAACRQHVPDSYQQLDVLPPIYPDYADVTIAPNIAPLNFEVFAEASNVIVRLSAKNEEIVSSGGKVRIDADEWKQIVAAAKGGAISAEVFIESNGRWARFTPFNIHVSPDSIDPWMSYRMIAPSYVSYEELTINQRCLEDFTEQVIVDNMLCSSEFGGQCVNCHNYQHYNPQRMQLHARQNHGGTIIAYDGELTKIDMNNDSLLSAGVYPAWHPTMKLIAYSTNKTLQSFHTAHHNKIEVLDTESDLILFDIDKLTVSSIEKTADELEVFPFWAPDGRSLYYCSAHFDYQDGSANSEEIIMRAQEVKYNIYRRSFDPATRHFGEREMVFCADTLGMSATLPRISPCGRWLLFTMGEWGCFHIWHHDADLWMMDLTTGEARPLDECNSPDTDSYHSWSSNGRWIVFSSRRHDGVFTRPFFVHIDADGHADKPFELPTSDPDYHLQLMKSYNVPEFISGPVTISPQTFAATLKTTGAKIKYLTAPQE